MTAPYELELTVERVAHGGICVAHAPDGRVVFVRHTLPGEQIRARVTEERKAYLRADAMEILRPAPGRVVPPCPWAGPGRCGGCDWQHVQLHEQRQLKSLVVREQLQRLAGLDVDVDVRAVPGDVDGLGWRTRMRFAVDDAGRAGLHRHRSSQLELIEDCLIAAPRMQVPALLAKRWSPGSEVTLDVSATGERAVAVGSPQATLTEVAGGREWAVPVAGFWQVHTGAPELLAATVVELAAPRAGERWLDLYSGVGLFAGVLADRGADVVAVESDRRAVDAARHNVPDVTVHRDRVDRWLRLQHSAFDGVVLDPPRKGAGRAVVEAVAARRPRAIVYVACDPAALARDAATLLALGFELAELRAFDLFPMTAHVECVALFRAPEPTAGLPA